MTLPLAIKIKLKNNFRDARNWLKVLIIDDKETVQNLQTGNEPKLIFLIIFNYKVFNRNF